MTLEDTLNEVNELGSYTGGLRGVKERIESGKGRSDKGTYDKGIAGLVLRFSDGEITPEQVELYNDMPSEDRDPIIDKYLPGAYKKVKEQLVEKVKPAYKEIVGELRNEELYGLLNLDYETSAGGDDEYSEGRKAKKESKKWEEVLEKKDIDAYIKSAENPIIREILEKYREDEDKMLELIGKRRGYYQMEFIKYFVDEKKLEELAKSNKGKIDEKAIASSIDSEKARGYIVSSIEKSEKVDEKLYELMGIFYAQSTQRKEIEKRNTASLEDVEKADKDLAEAT